MDLTKTLPIMGKKKEVTLIAKDAELVGDISFSSQLMLPCAFATLGSASRPE